MELREQARDSASRLSPAMRTPTAYRVCDGITEAVLYFEAVFAPWAFGATEHWSVWTMNVAGYVLGGLLLVKWSVRWRARFRPMRWGETDEVRGPKSEAQSQKSEVGREGGEAQNTERGTRNVDGLAPSRVTLSTTALATLTAVILAYCLVAAINARSTFVSREMAFVPHESIAWLPHSYDSRATWQAFWMYLGLALTFWAARDWFLGKTAKERRAARGEEREAEDRSTFPTRLQRLLWVLCLNGALLALEGILQRLSGTEKLLWLLQPVFNQTGDLQFGPYAYRSNAAQYFNLLWPVCLGQWWTLRRPNRRAGRAAGRMGSGPRVVLLPCAVLMAAAPIISSSRGGAIVAAMEMLGALSLLLFAQRKGHGLVRLGVILVFGAVLLLAGRLGWEKLGPRLKTILSDDMSGRVEIYRNAEQMALDFPVFGTGPGTFPQVYHLYRANAQATWAAYAHNDWLETLVTFGWVGFVPIILALGIVVLRWFGEGGINAQWLFVSLIWLALAGCLVHARFDFPLQIYSTLALSLHLCAILFCLSRKASRQHSA